MLSFGSRHVRLEPMLTAGLDSMDNQLYYALHGSWTFCAGCGCRRYGHAPPPPLVGTYAASVGCKCHRCSLSWQELEQDSSTVVPTERLYVTPQALDWPRYDSAQDAYILDGDASWPSLLELSKEEASSLCPLRIFCDVKMQRGQSGRAAIANPKKRSVMRAQWNAISVEASLKTPMARAAFAYLVKHNEACAHYVQEQKCLIAEGFPYGRSISTYGLLMRMPGVEAAAKPLLYPHSAYLDTDLRDRLRALGLSGEKQHLSMNQRYLRKLLSRCRAYSEDFELAFLLYDISKAHQVVTGGLFGFIQLGSSSFLSHSISFQEGAWPEGTPPRNRRYRWGLPFPQWFPLHSLPNMVKSARETIEKTFNPHQYLRFRGGAPSGQSPTLTID